MQLTTKGRYAVMAMVDLACYGTGEPISLQEISDRQEISLAYLEQIFTKMRRGGLVESVRGPGGGYVLARPAAEIFIADVMQAVEEKVKTLRCAPDSSKGCLQDKSRCMVHDLWEGLGQQISSYFESISLEDVMERRLRHKNLYSLMPEQKQQKKA